MRLPTHEPLVIATRGEAVESIHYGSIAVVDQSGELICSAGDVDFPVFPRSVLKPFQALPFMASNGQAHFGFSGQQLALLCASHSGEPRHVRAVADMLERIGCGEQDLRCGVHVPLMYEATGTRPPADLALSPLQHNCSGKHTGFLAWCRQHNQPLDSYLDVSHPLQQSIRMAVSSVFNCEEEDMILGIDGCGAPNYAVPMRQIARGYARLVSFSGTNVRDRIFAALFEAITDYPEMVSGAGRTDLAVMSAAPRDVIAKFGAESVQAVAFRSKGIAITVKIADGSSRALKVVIASVFDQMGLSSFVDDSPLACWRRPPITNDSGRQVGVLQAVFCLGEEGIPRT